MASNSTPVTQREFEREMGHVNGRFDSIESHLKVIRATLEEHSEQLIRLSGERSAIWSLLTQLLPVGISVLALATSIIVAVSITS